MTALSGLRTGSGGEWKGAAQMVWRGILRLCQAAVNLATALALLLCGSFGVYALWDNGQVLASVADVREELLRWKPDTERAADTEDNGESFARLCQVNPDVCGWITMDGTGIDFPVVQGQNNMHYISRDVFGNFSLAGSIFLDSRDDPAFGEGYALLYGHHMADGNMFGDLDRYKEEAFFYGNGTGQLILPDRVYRLEAVACIVVGASDRRIFDPDYVRSHRPELEDLIREKALHLREDLLEDTEMFLALSTCSTEFTDARTVVLTRMAVEEGEE